jgi:hypothetical protein
MYRDGRLLRPKRKRREGCCPHALFALAVIHSPRSSAGRGALLALHPLLQGGFCVADRAAQLDIGRAIAVAPALGQPRHAEVQVPRRLFRGQQDRRRGRSIGRRRTGSFGEHCRHRYCDIFCRTIFLQTIRQGLCVRLSLDWSGRATRAIAEQARQLLSN